MIIFELINDDDDDETAERPGKVATYDWPRRFAWAMNF